MFDFGIERCVRSRSAETPWVETWELYFRPLCDGEVHNFSALLATCPLSVEVSPQMVTFLEPMRIRVYVPPPPRAPMPTLETLPPPMECACHQCQGFCRHKPGWFLPGEAERAAELLGTDLPTLFRERLAVDWWEADEGFPDTFVLSPAIVSSASGQEMPGDPRGTCTFFKAGRCEIHAAKPYECRQADHTRNWSHVMVVKREVVRQWTTHQRQIRELLGREPEMESYSPWDLWD